MKHKEDFFYSVVVQCCLGHEDELVFLDFLVFWTQVTPPTILVEHTLNITIIYSLVNDRLGMIMHNVTAACHTQQNENPSPDCSVFLSPYKYPRTPCLLDASDDLFGRDVLMNCNKMQSQVSVVLWQRRKLI